MMPNDLPPEAHAYQKAWKKNQRALIKKGADRAYLYVHLEADSGEPFYIGMGETEGRPWSRRRSGKHKNRANKHGMRVDVDDMPCMSWELAGWWETRWIKAFRDAGYDLVNIADGGDGLSSRSAKEVNGRPEVRAKHIAYSRRPEVIERKRAARKDAAARRSPEQVVEDRKRISDGVTAAFKRREVKANIVAAQTRPETVALKSAATKAWLDRLTQEDWDRMNEQRLQKHTPEERSEFGKKGWATRVANGATEFTDEHCANIRLGVQAWRDSQTEEEKSRHALKVWESRRANGTDISGDKNPSKRLTSEQIAERSVKKTSWWTNKTDEERADIGRKMSEGRKRAKEAREGAAKLSELKD